MFVEHHGGMAAAVAVLGALALFFLQMKLLLE